MSIRWWAASAAALMLAVPAQAATQVDLNGLLDASLDGTAGVSVNLGAGSYSLSFVNRLFNGFNRFGYDGACDVNGMNCAQGWENTVRFIADGTTYAYGQAPNGGMGPLGNGTYYASAAQSLAAISGQSMTFTLANAQSVRFFIFDDLLVDNLGGVSLNITPINTAGPLIGAVPEPSTWAMMIFGVGATGAALRRRRRVAIA